MQHEDHKHHHEHHGAPKNQGSNHHLHMMQDFLQRFWVSSALTIPLLVLSPMIQQWFGYTIEFKGINTILLVLSSIVFIYGGKPFLSGMAKEIKRGKPGMMTLISLAVMAAYLYSLAVVLGLSGKTFFWEFATLIDVMLIGHWLEMKSILGASKSLEALAKLLPHTANLFVSDEIQVVDRSQLNVGDELLIRPGEKIPVDAQILVGRSEINESMLTGESKPILREPGEQVLGGSINGNGSLRVEVLNIGNKTYLSKVVELVKSAQLQKSKTQRLADTAAMWLTYTAIVLGLGTFIIWLSLGSELSFAMERMVTVMVISCPHALGLAIPLVASISTSISASNGLLIRNRTAFESARKISTIVFDKTGTLTEGSHSVSNIEAYSDKFTKSEILIYATSAEITSEHHIAKGLQKKIQEEGLLTIPAKDFKQSPGIGVSAIVGEFQVGVGGRSFLKKFDIEVPSTSSNSSDSQVYVVIEDELVGSIFFRDQIRRSSFGAIENLQRTGIKCVMLTGDNERVAKHVADKLGLDDFHANVLPDQKQNFIQRLQDQHEFVAMTGDGINDAPALAQANIGIAVGSGTDVAAETADIILVDNDPQDIEKLIRYGRLTFRKMTQNIGWATGYNIVALPLATGFIPGLTISPAIGAALMGMSTVICAINAQLLRRSLR